MPCGRDRAAGPENAGVFLEPVEDLLRREDPQSRGGQLQGQRDPVQPLAQRGDGLVVLVADAKARSDRLCTLGEQHDRVVLLRAT